MKSYTCDVSRRQPKYIGHNEAAQSIEKNSGSGH
ncbi:hypothetical protein Bhyg_06260 [Pseudolycoriella hygida]|uniref:Uncharacterized protein n=1 Tax=Pseudolycoriella hygida TaxID=35572 RepID=A0A9Q0S1R7_9DIPT|nr:hypothetical protein Bhyg_06260 [Pseudolycoriella hygida]